VSQPTYSERLGEVYRLLDHGIRADMVRRLKGGFFQVQTHIDTRDLETAELYAVYLRGLALTFSEHSAVLHDAVRTLRAAESIELDAYPDTGGGV
jgi:hypothetical protein